MLNIELWNLELLNMDSSDIEFSNIEFIVELLKSEAKKESLKNCLKMSCGFWKCELKGKSLKLWFDEFDFPS